MSKLMLTVFVLFHIKHFFADFPLQSVFMLGKAKAGLAWILPLSAHCAVHAGLSLPIILLVNPKMFWLVGLEFVAHFIIDKLKVSYKLPQGTWNFPEKGQYLAKYYTAFGLDQLAHQLCYVTMVFLLFTCVGCSTATHTFLDRMEDGQNRTMEQKSQDSADCIALAQSKFKQYDHPSVKDSNYYACMQGKGYTLN